MITEVNHANGLNEFKRAVLRIEQLIGDYGQVVKARGAESGVGSFVNGLVTRPQYGSMSDLSEAQKRAIAEVTKATRERLVADARGEAGKALANIAAEIEGIRAVLPLLAAKAAVDLGVIARALSDESNGRCQR